MSESPLSASGFADLLPDPPKVSAAFRAFSLQVVEPPPIHLRMAFADHVLSSPISGISRLRRAAGGRSVEGWSRPGTMILTPADLEATWDADGTNRLLFLHIPHAFLTRVIAEEWDAHPQSVEIVPQFLVRDPVVEGVLTRLALEVQSGSPLGHLYAESASEFLARHIIHSYSSLTTPPRQSAGGLPARRLNLALDYIEENLRQPIALHRLAELAGVSTRHFERAFRQTMGVPPHAYVVRKRVDAARDLLVREPALTIEAIAAQVGFSSGPHLAMAFRRRTGYSPTTFRRLQGLTMPHGRQPLSS